MAQGKFLSGQSPNPLDLEYPCSLEDDNLEARQTLVVGNRLDAHYLSRQRHLFEINRCQSPTLVAAAGKTRSVGFHGDGGDPATRVTSGYEHGPPQAGSHRRRADLKGRRRQRRTAGMGLAAAQSAQSPQNGYPSPVPPPISHSASDGKSTAHHCRQTLAAAAITMSEGEPSGRQRNQRPPVKNG